MEGFAALVWAMLFVALLLFPVMRIVYRAEQIALSNDVINGETSDGYHTFNELYEYRLLYNAAFFNELAKQGLYDVHKSRKHSDGCYPFGDSNWFIVMAELPTGQISNHYEMKDWDKFQIPEKELANKWDEHSPRDVADRLTSFTTPEKEETSNLPNNIPPSGNVPISKMEECKPAKSYAERIIEYREFVSLVKRMRKAQKRQEYTDSTLDREAMHECRKLTKQREKEVDEYLKKMEE